jgi:hypothetical protein
MTGSPHERCCPPDEPCPECLAYYAWLNRDLDRGTAAAEGDRRDDVVKSHRPLTLLSGG